MNQAEALNTIRELGYSYFYDELSEYESIPLAISSIFATIKGYASESEPKLGPGSWLTNEEATRIAIQEIKVEDLDQILLHQYGIRPDRVGGGKAFFERLHEVIVEGINIAKSHYFTQ